MTLSIKNLFYVDDLILGETQCKKNLTCSYMAAKQAMAEGGFNLQKWNSNSSKNNSFREFCNLLGF